MVSNNATSNDDGVVVVKGGEANVELLAEKVYLEEHAYDHEDGVVGVCGRKDDINIEDKLMFIASYHTGNIYFVSTFNLQ